MPSKVQRSFVVALRGDDAYTRGLDRLLKAVRAKGVPVESRHQLADYALATLAEVHGVKLPDRVKPVGTNQHGPPKAKTDGP